MSKSLVYNFYHNILHETQPEYQYLAFRNPYPGIEGCGVAGARAVIPLAFIGTTVDTDTGGGSQLVPWRTKNSALVNRATEGRMRGG